MSFAKHWMQAHGRKIVLAMWSFLNADMFPRYRTSKWEAVKYLKTAITISNLSLEISTNNSTCPTTIMSLIHAFNGRTSFVRELITEFWTKKIFFYFFFLVSDKAMLFALKSKLIKNLIRVKTTIKLGLFCSEVEFSKILQLTWSPFARQCENRDGRKQLEHRHPC